MARNQPIAFLCFDPFTTQDEARTSGKGNGLGLAISAKIVRMMGNDIDTQSLAVSLCHFYKFQFVMGSITSVVKIP